MRNERDGLGSDICAVGYAVLIMPASDQTRDASTADELLRRIESVTDVTLAHLGVEDLLVELLERVQGLLDIDTAAVLLLDASGEYLVATAARGSRRRFVREFGFRWERVLPVESRHTSNRCFWSESTTPTCSTRSCGSAESGPCLGCRC